MVKILIDEKSKSKLYLIPINLIWLNNFFLHFTAENHKVTDQTKQAARQKVQLKQRRVGFWSGKPANEAKVDKCQKCNHADHH